LVRDSDDVLLSMVEFHDKVRFWLIWALLYDRDKTLNFEMSLLEIPPNAANSYSRRPLDGYPSSTMNWFHSMMIIVRILLCVTQK
jgi:hypothetical protein